jgi:2-oxoglutarate dehydrogenase E2 component (dihydrolipoamide succinyltransferase)
MIIEIKVPTPGESITEVEIGKWIVSDGDLVEKDQELGEIESDKATLTLSASESGQIKIVIPEGERAAVGAIACTIDTSKASAPKAEKPAAAAKVDAVKEVAAPAPEKVAPPEVSVVQEESNVKVTSVAKKMMEEYHLSMEEVLSGLHRISKGDIEAVLALPKEGKSPAFVSAKKETTRAEKREKMTSLRRKLSQRLVAVKNETAMLTTFNEIDMSRVMDMRS